MIPQWVFTFTICVLVLVIAIAGAIILILLFKIKGVEMPNPNNYDTREAFMEACIPMRVNEGDEQDQAVAVCSSMWENKKDIFKGLILKHE